MVNIAVLVLSLLSIGASVQVQNGTYKSVSPSFQNNFFLVIEGNKALLYGWELDEKKDTIYYRSSGRFERNGQLRFNQFDFSRQPVTAKTLASFSPSRGLTLNPLLLHTRLSNIKQDNNQLFLSATKDSYDSRADKFVFKRIR